MTARTIADADDYWDRYYSGEFIAGLGTETVLAALAEIPPVGTWIDLGAGSESLLWSIALQTRRLVAVDLDPRRLTLLRAFAATRRPRPAYQTALALRGRTAAEFAERCDRLAAVVVADCLTGRSLPLRPGSVDLVTQFGLLGLTTSPEQFLSGWHHAHQLLATGGWTAGANWTTTGPDTNRVHLSRQLYTAAFARSRITVHHLERIPITGDPDFNAVWIYLGRKP
ncbi:class I SAM-dependent methyltransferase [Frankia sp. Ag45/Mut15]|uniref:Class I SAM-dependent methyltransferase n=1 Tax=Frankia umida TaxID=573489 RepID=A0ABT0JV29_9ACTN|nr:class I SAM-dependent methyltransferase [Frankia umida]MCK9875401.1 class I SAM-dependent methyltransferase [Frankia umida]